MHEAGCRPCGLGLHQRTSLSGLATEVTRSSKQANPHTHTCSRSPPRCGTLPASRAPKRQPLQHPAKTTVSGVNAKASRAEAAMESALAHTSVPRGPSEPCPSTLRTSAAASSGALRCIACALPSSAPSTWPLCASERLAVLAPELTLQGAWSPAFCRRRCLAGRCESDSYIHACSAAPAHY